MEHGILGAPGNRGAASPAEGGGGRGTAGLGSPRAAEDPPGRFLEAGEGGKACRWVRADVLVWGVDR